ncbi:hypothetical protein [uncultured Roseovarius sp.]|uniref:hypothetical protein n=1 Tax=uncultured Roseovarius sp. TaxID=293344 RepID=UPI00262D2BDE|nr:hypothetical protein [uncultured Roseovarius sp.]
MNANQIVNMVVRIVMRKLMRSGVNAGMDAVGKRMNRGKEDGPKMTDTAETGKRAKQTMRMMRRLR